jgi:hypothetical protein
MNLSWSDRGGAARNSRQLDLGMPDAEQRNVDNPGHPLADEVLAYLLQHPQAQDTMEGIAEWWLLEQRIRHSVADVEATLRELVGNDFLIARRCGEGRMYYGLNRDKEREIRRHLRRAEAAQEKTPNPTEPLA